MVIVDEYGHWHLTKYLPVQMPSKILLLLTVISVDCHACFDRFTSFSFVLFCSIFFFSCPLFFPLSYFPLILNHYNFFQLSSSTRTNPQRLTTENNIITIIADFTFDTFWVLFIHDHTSILLKFIILRFLPSLLRFWYYFLVALKVTLLIFDPLSHPF